MDTDGIAAKLWRCGIASEALQQNMTLKHNDNKILKVDILLSRNVVVIVQAPRVAEKICVRQRYF